MMFLECLVEAAGAASVISEWSLAAVVLIVRFVPNGVDRVECCTAVPDHVAESAARSPDCILLDPVPDGFLDCACVALGAPVSVSSGTYRALADDLAEIVLL